MSYFNGGGWGAGAGSERVGMAPTFGMGNGEEALAKLNQREKIKRAKEGYLESDQGYDWTRTGGGSGGSGGGGGAGAVGASFGTDQQTNAAKAELEGAKNMYGQSYGKANYLAEGMTPEQKQARLAAAQQAASAGTNAAAAGFYNSSNPGGVDPFAAFAGQSKASQIGAHALIDENAQIQRDDTAQRAQGIGLMNQSTSGLAGLSSQDAGYEANRYDRAGVTGQMKDAYDAQQGNLDTSVTNDYNRQQKQRALQRAGRGY